jgi:P27 family predicted phage terminase small subunit
LARPSKSVDVMSKNFTKEEYETRKRAEESLKGGTDKINPPAHLNKNAKSIFKYIVSELEASSILTNLDIYILAECAIAIDRIQEAEKVLNKNLFNKEALKIKESYMKEFFRCCNELCLSPQARAKLAIINSNSEMKKDDPLLMVLGGGKK